MHSYSIGCCQCKIISWSVALHIILSLGFACTWGHWFLLDLQHHYHTIIKCTFIYIYIKDMIFSDLWFSPKHFPLILNQAIKSVNKLNECQVYKIQVSLKFHSAEISSVKEQFVAQEQNTMTWPGLELRLPIPKATKSPHPYKGSPLNFLLFAKEQTYLLHPGVFQKQGAMFWS